MMIRIAALLIVLLSPVAIAAQQYTESACLLLKQQVQSDKRRHGSESTRYQKSQASYDAHCQSPVPVNTNREVLTAPKQTQPTPHRKSLNTAHLSPAPLYEKQLSHATLPTPAMPTQVKTAPTEPMTLSAFAVYLVGVMVVLILGPAILRRKLPAIKGWLGEAMVQRALAKRLNPELYTTVHDVTLPLDDGGTTQIDHIVFSPYGIFVIETKNMSGWIFGNEKQANWTQTIGRKKFSFQNPLRQNYKHTKTLAALLDQPHSLFHSVVVFVGDAKLKTMLPSNVGSMTTTIRYIRSFEEPVIAATDVNRLVQHLETARLHQSHRSNKRHISYLRDKMTQNQTNSFGDD